MVVRLTFYYSTGSIESATAQTKRHNEGTQSDEVESPHSYPKGYIKESIATR